MEVILKQDVQNLGYADDIVKVKDGYARNYLIPQGFAIVANEANRKQLAETKKQRAFKEEKIRKEAEFMAGKIDGLTVKVAAKAAENGTLFGSITNILVADALKEQHDIEIDRRKIMLQDDHIKMVGNYTAQVNLHREFKVNLNIEVVAETAE